ncbi:MAG: hypothetical protein ACOYOV_00190 [Bacteroidales bacterium]
MLNIYKHLVLNGYTLNSNPFGGKSTFIYRGVHGDTQITESRYMQAFLISNTQILRALYA